MQQINAPDFKQNYGAFKYNNSCKYFRNSESLISNHYIPKYYN